jgi:nuclear GTP-binding protein
LDFGLNFSDPTRKIFYREFKKVVKASDVILEVLDARDPNGTRCPAIEQSVSLAVSLSLSLSLSLSN